MCYYLYRNNTLDYFFKGVLLLIFRNRNSEFVIYVSPYNIEPNPYQPRKNFDYDSLYSLSESIKSSGVLQPLIVRDLGNNSYELISGERRLRASKIAGLSVVPCLVKNVDVKDSAMFAILENLQREDLNFFEEAESLLKLMHDFGFTQSDIGKKLGKSQSSLSNKIRLLKIPADLRVIIIENALTERHARALIKLGDTDIMKKALKYIIENKLNVSQTEKYIESLLNDSKSVSNKPKLRMLTDVRLFINSITQAVNTMTDAGIDADLKRTEDENRIYFTVTIDKSKKVYNSVS